jgi:hypothetical protein
MYENSENFYAIHIVRNLLLKSSVKMRFTADQQPTTEDCYVSCNLKYLDDHTVPQGREQLPPHTVLDAFIEWLTTRSAYA